MPKRKRRDGPLNAPLGWEEVQYASWDEWFKAQERFHEFTGVPYDQIIPPKSLVQKLGPMPTPPWQRPSI